MNEESVIFVVARPRAGERLVVQGGFGSTPPQTNYYYGGNYPQYGYYHPSSGYYSNYQYAYNYNGYQSYYSQQSSGYSYGYQQPSYYSSGYSGGASDYCVQMAYRGYYVC